MLQISKMEALMSLHRIHIMSKQIADVTTNDFKNVPALTGENRKCEEENLVSLFKEFGIQLGDRYNKLQ